MSEDKQKEDVIELPGVVVEEVRGAFRVKLDGMDHVVLCRLAGKMRKFQYWNRNPTVAAQIYSPTYRRFSFGTSSTGIGIGGASSGGETLCVPITSGSIQRPLSSNAIVPI